MLDPLAIGVFRFGIGGAVLLPFALLQGAGWPRRQDWPGVVALGLLFFGLFPILFSAALIYTTAARGALALSTLPLLTMLTAALLRVEPLGLRKAAGVLIAMAGVAIALVSGLADAPVGAWRGDLLMVTAAFCMALYSVWSRPFIARSGPIPFTAMAMAAGAAGLTVVSLQQNSFAPLHGFGPGPWIALFYLGLFGGALAFWLWAYALRHTTPTRVAVSVTVNPIAASLVGAAILREPLHWQVGLGLLGVFGGIWIAMSEGGAPRSPGAVQKVLVTLDSVRGRSGSRWRA